MADEIDCSDSEHGLLELLKHVFITSSHLDNASATEEELATLNELDSQEILENLKEIVLSLLKFKEAHRDSDVSELAEQTEKFESMVQKLEGEVRKHIRTEHQLKLHVEDLQNQVDEFEIEKQRQSNDIKELRRELNSLNDGKYRAFEEKLQSEIERVKKRKQDREEGMPRTLRDTEREIAKLRKISSKQAEELEELKKTVERERKPRVNRKILGKRQPSKAINVKKRVDNRVAETSGVENTPSKGKRCGKYSKRGSTGNDISEIRPQSMLRKHMRSQSDYNAIKRRAPSR